MCSFPRYWWVIGLLLMSSTVAMAAPVRYLVAVGNNRGLSSEMPLQYAEKDARRYARLMQKRGDVPRSNVTVLTGRSSAEVWAALNRVKQSAARHNKEDVTVFFYYSGHGNEDELHVGATRLSLKTLDARLAAIPAGLRIGVIDACRSDRGLNYKGMRRTKGFAIQLKSAAGIQGTVILKSSSEGEASQESEALGGAVFTHYLLTALRGAADRDRDREVTLDEAYQYAYRQTVQRSASGPGNVMHPSVKLDVEGAGQLMMTRSLRGQAQVILPQRANVQYILYRKPAGTVIAEVWSDPKRAITLHVPKGQFLLQRRASGLHGAYQFKVASKAVETVDSAKFHAYPSATLQAKGGFLDVWRHELKAGYGAVLNHHARYSQRVRVGYGYGVAMWTVGIGLDVGMGGYDIDQHTVEERWFGGDVAVSFRRLLGPIDLSAGFAWRLVEQNLVRNDASLLGNAGFEDSTGRLGLAWGPTAAIGWRWMLSPRWFMALELSGHGWLRKEGDSLVFRPEGALETALGMDF